VKNPDQVRIIALLSLIPFAVWISAQGYLQATLQTTWLTLLLTQALSLALCVPFWCLQARHAQGLRATLLLVLIPLPLHSILWLMGTVSAVEVAGGLLVLSVLSIGIGSILRLALERMDRRVYRQHLVPVCQVFLCLFALHAYTTLNALP
jgi:hypothetical protein